LVIRGGAGLYTQQHLLYYINRAQLEGPGGTLTMTLSPGSPLFPSFPNVLTTLPPAASLPPLDIAVASPDSRHPPPLQATVGSPGRLHALASYTWSHAEDLDNYLLPEDSRNLEAEKAVANTNVAHNFTAGFSWQLPGTARLLNGFSLSGIGTFRSGRPYTITW